MAILLVFTATFPVVDYKPTVAVKPVASVEAYKLPKAVIKPVPKVENKAVIKVVPKIPNSVLHSVVSKPLPKPVPKVVPKQVPKQVPKVAPKVVTKTVTKPVPKPVQKVAPKQPVKTAPKATPKPVSKPVVKVAPKPVQTYYRKTARGLELSKYEYELLVKIAHSEAGGDGMQSQIGVVNVVLNRVHFGGWFPTDIHGVIYQEGQFSPVADGRINEPVNAENYTAVDRVLAGENNVGDCQFFWADYVDKNHFLWSKPVLYKYGQTVFAN